MVNYVDKADLFEYSFATGQSKRLTNLPYGFIRRVTISPDGQKIVYEYQENGYWYEENPAIDLWIMNRDGSQAALFVENGRAPAWSPRPLPVLPPPTTPKPTPTLPPPVDLPFRLLLPLITH
jgi:Tol biopolymer transport system component